LEWREFKSVIRGLLVVQTINNIEFSGPTYFAPLIRFWNDMVKFEIQKNTHKYYIFLLLTDGVNHDMDETIEEIVISSNLPISIIIVGIGTANFDNMRVLDADDQTLYSPISKLTSARDNVQFVEYNRFKDNPHELTRETLEEVPRQMVDYFKSAQMTPEKMRAFDPNLEARDFFQHKAFQFMQRPDLGVYNPDVINGLIEKGISDDETLNVLACVEDYH
jgi:hypothetical protein